MSGNHDGTLLEIIPGLFERLQTLFDSIMQSPGTEEEKLLLPESVAEFVLSRLSAAMKTEASVLFIQGNPSVHYFYLRGRGGSGGLFTVRDVKPGSSMAAWVAKHGEPLITSEGTVDESLLAWPVGNDEIDVHDALCVPIIKDGLVHGALGVANKEAGSPLGKPDLIIVSMIAHPVSVFLSILASCQDIYRRFRENNLLSRMESSTDTVNQNQFSKSILENTVSFFSCDAGCLYYLDHEQEVLIPIATAGDLDTPVDLELENDAGLTGAAFQGGIPVIVGDCLADPRYNPDLDGAIEKPTSILIQPLVREELTVGLIVLYRTTGKPFSASDQSLTEKIARLIISVRTRIRYLKSLEKSKGDLVAELEQINQLQKKTTEFMSGLGAAMRTPLFSMKSTIELLQERVPGDLNEHQCELIRVVSRDIDKLDRSIFDLLVFTEIDRGRGKLKMVPTNLAIVIREAAETLEKQMEVKQLGFMLDLPDGLPSLFADAERLKHVFINLLSNAVNWSPQGSNVRVIVTSDEVYISIKIIDSGPGIPEEEWGKIFDLFYQPSYVKNHDSGNDYPVGRGLGLALAKEVVEVHEGHIGVTSKSGEGSVFEVKLPLVRGGES